MSSFFQDLRYGARQLWSNPGFTIAVVLCIALGIGANTAVFSYTNALLFQMPEVDEPESLVRLYMGTAKVSRFEPFAYANYVDVRDKSDVFTSVVAEAVIPFNLSAGEHKERVSGSIVSDNYFSSLGVETVLGRAFSPEAPLMKYHLVHLHDDHTSRPTPLIVKFLQIDERITSYLLETDQIDARLLPFTHIANPKLKLRDMILTDETKRHLDKLIMHFNDRGVICHLHGTCGVGRQATAEAVCSELGVPVLIADVNRMMTVDIPPDLSVPLIFREGRLQNAALYFDGSRSGDNVRAVGGEVRERVDGGLSDRQVIQRVGGLVLECAIGVQSNLATKFGGDYVAFGQV